MGEIAQGPRADASQDALEDGTARAAKLPDETGEAGLQTENIQTVNEGRQTTFVIAHEHLLHLPAPVRRYLTMAGVIGAQNIRRARLTQTGFLRKGRRWLPFIAQQSFATDPPGFAWQAKVRFAPLLSFSVSDRFSRGHGRLQAKLLSVIKVAEAVGPEADQGELLRYQGEIAWFPTAWLSRDMEWGLYQRLRGPGYPPPARRRRIRGSSL